MLTIILPPSSWRYHCRCPSRGEEEAGSRQGPQDAYLGQALKRGEEDLCRAMFFYYFLLPIMYYSTCMAARVRQSCSISCTMHMGLYLQSMLSVVSHIDQSMVL